ncbi:MAG: GGDEF domain-containing protein [Rhodanobacteraceae bacterium]|jgi:diguanylate cyclase (GGDEF)-like protein|nr:GGDEF domain-containing protein [Rhodanobacteraceae bacterium]MBL0042528.1 GGDEF domain-containing protein [Xanthomonadales bacterium]MBP7622906.1 GGDEF domain-containing protein [Xanthomonadales bacterium]
MTTGSAPEQPLNERLRAIAARMAPVLLGFDLAASERLQQHRVLRQRLVSMAVIVTIGLLAWIPIDLQTLPTPVASHLLGLRLGLGALVLLIAWTQHGATRLPPVVAIALFIALQAVGFAWMEAEIPKNADPLLRLGYGLFPFIIAAQIAVFPLPLAVTLTLSAPAIGLLLLLLDLMRARNDAAHDGLTGLANRRSAMARLAAEIAQAQRRKQSLALLALDLDHFKQVNDRHGHAAGDRVLIEFAATLRDSLRQGDLGARVGGEEFIAILPQTDREAAAIVAERIRERCEALQVRRDDGVVIRFTISIGLAMLDGSDVTGSLLARADVALYRAKREGRNRVALAG